MARGDVRSLAGGENQTEQVNKKYYLFHTGAAIIK
jgi:hypothetical protein